MEIERLWLKSHNVKGVRGGFHNPFAEYVAAGGKNRLSNFIML